MKKSATMSIEINNIGNNPVHHSVKRDKTAGESALAPEAKDTSRTQDEIQLSEQAKQLKSLQSASTNSVDRAKVDRIRSAITEGRYHIDPVRLAEKFIALEGELSNIKE